MSTINDGGQAFPCVDSDPSGQMHLRDGGMTLRDYFAAKAMQGILAHPKCGFIDEQMATFAAREAFELADAMIAAREVKA